MCINIHIYIHLSIHVYIHTYILYYRLSMFVFFWLHCMPPLSRSCSLIRLSNFMGATHFQTFIFLFTARNEKYTYISQLMKDNSLCYFSCFHFIFHVRVLTIFRIFSSLCSDFSCSPTALFLPINV